MSGWWMPWGSQSLGHSLFRVRRPPVAYYDKQPSLRGIRLLLVLHG